MPRFLTAVLLAVAALLAAPQHLHAQHRNIVEFHGIIAKVGHESVTFHVGRHHNVEIRVDRNTRIARNGEPARLQDLQRGDRANVVAERTREGLLGRSIDAFQLIQIGGTIVGLGHDGFLLRTLRGDVRFRVDENTIIFRDRERVRFGALEVGDRAMVQARPDAHGFLALRINASSSALRLDGRISQIGENIFALETREGSVRIRVDEHTVIFRDRQQVRFGALEVGDRAMVEARRDGHGLLALRIHAQSGRSGFVDLGGTIVEIGRHNFTLRTHRGDVQVWVDEHTRITRNGQRATFHELQVRDQARVRAQWVGSGHERRLLARAIAARGH